MKQNYREHKALLYTIVGEVCTIFQRETIGQITGSRDQVTGEHAGNFHPKER